MSLASLFLRLSRRPTALPSALTAARSMGGGPRTFPGGLSKWQYKRMHEKLAKEKERKLLHQEKQLYQARLRSEIRAKAAGGIQSPPSNPSSDFGPMSSKDHIKALADRFMKQGAEDLWNDDDGPISEKRPQKLAAKPLDLKKIVKDGRSSVPKLGSFQQRRDYSKWRRNSSSEDEELDGGGLIRKELKISRFGIGNEEEEERRSGGRRKKMMSGAALRNFDRKKERRRPTGDEDEEESDLLEQIRGIHEDIKKMASEQGEGEGRIGSYSKEIMQSFIVAPQEVHFHLVHHLLKEHIMQEVDYKVILFWTTSMGAAFMYALLRDLKMNVREMHSRKPPLYRVRISDEFQESKCLILVTSDVSSRGVHYPDVTLVIQVGIPSDREQYIHRFGRTGREGKDGKVILLLSPWEEYFMQEMRDLPVEKHPLPELDSDLKQKVEESIGKVDLSTKEAAYHAWLGYYNSISDIGRDKTLLADLANRFCYSIGLEKPLSLYRKTALKMGLKDIPGIRITK